jgi:antitoxin ParD1/3/4
MTISLTPELEEFVLKEVNSGLYASASEVILAGLRQLKEAKERKPGFMISSRVELEEKLVEGLGSGPATEMKDSDWRRIRNRVHERAGTKAG